MFMQRPGKSTKIALISILAALGLAIQLAPRPPNVEFTLLLTFSVGYMSGTFSGIFFGSFIMFFNGFFSPWGFAGLNMPFQMFGASVTGLAGGLYQRYMQNHSAGRFCVEASIVGAFLTVLYDLVTNFGVALSLVMVGMHPALAVATAIAYGAPFSLVHVVSNIVVFGIAFLPITRALNYTLVGEKFWLKKEQ